MSTTRRRTFEATLTIGILMLLGAFGCGIAAVWTEGGLSNHLGGTAAILGFTGFFVTMLSGLLGDL